MHAYIFVVDKFPAPPLIKILIPVMLRHGKYICTPHAPKILWLLKRKSVFLKWRTSCTVADRIASLVAPLLLRILCYLSKVNASS